MHIPIPLFLFFALFSLHNSIEQAIDAFADLYMHLAKEPITQTRMRHIIYFNEPSAVRIMLQTISSIQEFKANNALDRVK